MSTEEWGSGYDEGYMKGWNDAMDEKPAQPQQEPVAYIRKDQLQKAAQSPMLCEVTLEPRQDPIGIYTSPPAQRTWVGLTRRERFEIEKAMSKYYDYQHECKTVCLPEFAAAIEAKLKEKNT